MFLIIYNIIHIMLCIKTESIKLQYGKGDKITNFGREQIRGGGKARSTGGQRTVKVSLAMGGGGRQKADPSTLQPPFSISPSWNLQPSTGCLGRNGISAAELSKNKSASASIMCQ